MWVRSIVKGSIPRTGDERFDSAAGRSTGIVVWLSSDCPNWRCNTRQVAFLASVSSRTSIWKEFQPYDTPQLVAGQARGKLQTGRQGRPRLRGRPCPWAARTSLYKTNFSPVLNGRVVEKSRDLWSSGSHQGPRGTPHSFVISSNLAMTNTE